MLYKVAILSAKKAVERNVKGRGSRNISFEDTTYPERCKCIRIMQSCSAWIWGRVLGINQVTTYIDLIALTSLLILGSQNVFRVLLSLKEIYEDA